MTLNEKFLKVSGLSLDVEGMIATCPSDKKEELYNKLSWNIGLLLSTTVKEGKFTSDGSDKAETLKEIYNLLISIPVEDPTALEKAIETLVPGEPKTVEITKDMKVTTATTIAKGCDATIVVPANTTFTVNSSTSKAGLEVNGKLTIDVAGSMAASTSGGNGSRCFLVHDGGDLTINSGDFTANSVVALNGGKATINDGDFSSVEACVIPFVSDNESTTVIINDGNFTSTDNGVIMGNGTKAENGKPSKVVIKGGTFNGSITTDGYVANGIYCPNIDEYEIDGATFNITDGCCICSRAGKVTIKNTTINMIYTNKALESGRVGDSRVVVPCVPFVFDEAANYPGLKDDSGIYIGENVTINYTGEYVHSGKKAALITGTSAKYETLFDDDIKSRIYGI